MKTRLTATMLIVAGAAVVQACGDDDSASSIPDIDAGVHDAAADHTTPPPFDSGGGSDVNVTPFDAGPKLDANTSETSVDSGDAGDAGDGSVTSLDGGGCDGGAVTLGAVTPQFGATGSTTAITISGSGFVWLPRVAVVSSTGVVTLATNAAFVSSTSITATIPSGLAAGNYDIAVVNPGECAGILAGGFQVTANPAPLVLSVAPARGTTQSDVAVTVTGCFFQANATISTLDAAGTVLAQTVTAAPANGAADARCNGQPLETMTGTIGVKTKAMTAGAYVLRVSNPTDKTFGDYSSFVVSNPSGNLTGGWTAATSLVIARRSLGLVAGRLDDAHRYLYAVGGEDAAGNALKSVEVAAVDRFGQLGAWSTLPSQLGSGRSGLAVVQRGLYLYAIGGTSSKDGTRGANATDPSGTPLATIEHAKLLQLSGAPVLTAATASTASGALPKGAWYYRVAAVLDGTDPDTEGETLPSEELVASLSAAGKIVINWNAPPAGSVKGYRVYRTATGDAASGTETLLADNVNATTFTDTGAATPGTEKPYVPGATGHWIAAGTSLVHGRFNTAATVAADTLGALHLYVMGGWGQCGGGAAAAMDCYEYASLSDDGKTLGAFTAGATTMGQARMGLSADTLSGFLLVAGGKNVNGPNKTVEYALIAPGGALGTFANPGGFSNERDGTKLLVANGYAYTLFGGSAPGYSQTADQSSQATTTATTLTFANWNNAGANFGTKIGRHGAAAESAYFYVAGGTTTDTDALATVFQILH